MKMSKVEETLEGTWKVSCFLNILLSIAQIHMENTSWMSA